MQDSMFMTPNLMTWHMKLIGKELQIVYGNKKGTKTLGDSMP